MPKKDYSKKIRKLEKKIRIEKLEPLELKKRILYTFSIFLIGYGFFFFTIAMCIRVFSNSSISNIWAIFYLLLYFLVLTIPSKFTWETIYINYGKIAIYKKWIITILFLIISVILPIYQTLAMINIWYYRKEK